MNRPLRSLGFTLVELLVVIGIIALLISILLPSLNAARAASQNLKCLSNIRQLTTAALMFQAERRNLQTVSDNAPATRADPSRRKWIYATDGGGNPYVMDWASALLPYLGVRNKDALIGDEQTSGVFQCPSDVAMDASPQGYYPGNNFRPSPSTDYVRMSYAINADICSIKDPADSSRRSMFHNLGVIGVFKGPNSGNYGTNPGPVGDALEGRLDRVKRSSETMLFADSGVRPYVINEPTLNRQDSLYWTTNYMVGNGGDPNLWGTLAGIMQTPWLRTRIPLQRHANRAINATNAFQGRGGKVNIGFCDGHAETVSQTDFARVKITPY